MGWDFTVERILGNSHSQTQGNDIYNMKFILMGSNWSKTYDLKVSNFLFSQNKWAIQRGRLLVPWPISAVYVIGSYERHILNKTIIHKTHRDHIIWRLHTLIGFLHQKSIDVVQGTFHVTEVVNLRERKSYKKIVTERPHQKIWDYYITTKNYLWMVKHCAGVTPKPTQKRGSKTLFQLGLVVSVISTYRRGLYTELIDILFAN